MSAMNWRDKDDLDLTSEDVDAMLSEGQRVGVRGPSTVLPHGAHLITGASSWGLGSKVDVRPRDTGMRVSRPVPVSAVA